MRLVFWTAAGGIGFGLGGIVAGFVAIAAAGYVIGKGVEKIKEALDD